MGKKYCLLFSLLFLIFSSNSASPEETNINQELPIIYEKNTLSSSTVIHILIRGGTASEPADKKGLAYLTTSLSIGIINSNERKQMTQMGSSLSIRIDGDFSQITIRCLSSNLEQTLKIIFGVMSGPLFSSFRINRIKTHMKHQQKAEQDNPIRLLNLKQRQIFFNRENYGSSIYGDSDSLKNIKRRDVLAYYREHFNRANMIIGASSSLEKSTIIDIFNRLFPELSPPRKHLNPSRSAVSPDLKSHFFKKDRKQTLIAIIICNTELGPGKITSAFLLENLLGKGLGSKLWYLREQKKMAYFVDANLWQVKDSGILSIYLKTNNEKVSQADQALTSILNRLQINGVSSEELDIHKKHAKAYFLRMMETSRDRIFLKAFFEIMETGPFDIDQFLSQIDRISQDDFNAYTKKILQPENRIKIVIGPEVPNHPTLQD